MRMGWRWERTCPDAGGVVEPPCGDGKHTEAESAAGALGDLVQLMEVFHAWFEERGLEVA